MVNLVRVKRKRGLPSPADRLYVDVNDGQLGADDNLLAGLSLDNSGNGAASSAQIRPRRTKRYRRIVGNMTLLELEAQAFRDGFETGVDRAESGGPPGQAGEQAGEQAGGAGEETAIKGPEEMLKISSEVKIETAIDSTVGAKETTLHSADASNSSKRKQCSMTYAVVKRRRESHHVMSSAPETHGERSGLFELDPLRRLGGGYRVCDLEFTPSTPDAKAREEDDDELYDLYVEEDGDNGAEDSHVWEMSESCAVVYVDDCDFFMPEFDEDQEDSDLFDSDDSNAEDYFLNDYPDEEEGDGEERGDDGVDGIGYRVGPDGLQGFGWDSEEGDEGYGEESDEWNSDFDEY